MLPPKQERQISWVDYEVGHHLNGVCEKLHLQSTDISIKIEDICGQ